MTTETSTSSVDVSGLVAANLAAWNEPDEAKRAPMIERTWAPDGQLTDPPFAVEGHAGILGAMSGVHAQYPGHRFRQVSAVDSHHSHFRYGWELVGPDRAMVLAGIDIGEVAEDGRLRRVTGFWGDLERST